MWLYLLVFGLLAALTLFRWVQPLSPAGYFATTRWSLGLMAVLLTLIVGLRHEVGGDWVGYFYYLELMHEAPIASTLSTNEPGYLLLNWLGANWGGGIYAVNLLSALLMMIGITAFCRSQPKPLLTLVVALPYLVVVVGMGYTRQAIAIGFVMLAISALYKARAWRYLLWVLVAVLFHKTAVVMLPFAFFALQRNKVFYGLLMLLMGGLFALAVLPYADYYLANYVTSEYYESSGAMVRLLMTVLPAVFYILNSRRFALNTVMNSFWRAMAWSSVGLLLLLLVFPQNSTAIDRLALYWLPLQLMVLSQLPNVLVIKGLGRKVGSVSIVLYSAFFYLVWLFWATHAHAWLPYQFYPWVWLWS